MILSDFYTPVEKHSRVVREIYETFDRDKLDAVLAECCAGIIRGQKLDPEYFGMVASCVIDSRDRLVFGISHLDSEGKRVHAERAALDEYARRYGHIPRDSIVVTTLSPCSSDTLTDRAGDSCTQMLDDYQIRRVYCGFEDPTQNDTVLFNNRTFEIEQTDNQKIRDLCRQMAETFLSNVGKEELDEILKLPVGDYGKKGTITPMREPKNAKPLPGGSGYTYSVQGDDNRKEVLMFIDGNLAAELDIYRVKAPVPLWGVEAVVAEPEYQGRGLAMALYGIVLSILKLTLKAGDSQTFNGQRQWLKLAQIPGVEVKGITKTPTSEYRPREGEEVLWTQGRNTVHTFSVGQGSKSMRSDQRGVGLYGNEESSMIAKWTGK